MGPVVHISSWLGLGMILNRSVTKPQKTYFFQPKVRSIIKTQNTQKSFCYMRADFSPIPDMPPLQPITLYAKVYPTL